MFQNVEVAFEQQITGRYKWVVFQIPKQWGLCWRCWMVRTTIKEQNRWKWDKVRKSVFENKRIAINEVVNMSGILCGSVQRILKEKLP